MSKKIRQTSVMLSKSCSNEEFLLVDLFTLIPKFIEYLPSKCGVIFKYVHVKPTFYKHLVILSGKVENLLTEQLSHGGKFVAC
jgi:hypothetical protein